MKSPGVIYRQYRKLYRRALYEKMKEARKEIHDNCAYGKLITIKNNSGESYQIKLCAYSCLDFSDAKKARLNLDLLDHCTNPKECNAFAYKQSKEDVEKQLEEEFNDPDTKHEKYPELSAYEWVLDKSLTEAKKDPGFFGNFIVFLINLLEHLLEFVSGSKTKLMKNSNS